MRFPTRSSAGTLHVVVALAIFFAVAVVTPPGALAGTCGPCSGGRDGPIAPCNDWQTLAGNNDGDADRRFGFGASGGACGSFQSCNDDRCSVSSRLEWTAPADGSHVLRVGGYADCLRPGIVTDPTDGKLAQLDRLNLSRAGCSMDSELPTTSRRPRARQGS